MSLFLPIIDALNRGGVEYVVVGGLAVLLHGHPRLTRDVDIVISLDTKNVHAAIDALTRIGMEPRAPVDPRDFADPDKRKEWIETKGMVVFSMANPANPLVSVDLFCEPPLDWSHLWANSVFREMEGAQVRVCSIDDLITIKRRVERQQDLQDVEALQIIREDQNA